MNRELTLSEKMLQEACQYIGMREIVDKDKHNVVILKMFAEIGYNQVLDDETAWCSCFINYLALKIHASRSGKLNARSWMHAGQPTKTPVPGDIVVFWREKPESWKGHVGIFIGYNEHGNIYCLGGNQDNEVDISVYYKERVLGYRRLLHERNI